MLKGHRLGLCFRGFFKESSKGRKVKFYRVKYYFAQKNNSKHNLKYEDIS